MEFSPNAIQKRQLLFHRAKGEKNPHRMHENVAAECGIERPVIVDQEYLFLQQKRPLPNPSVR
jgi:hypothetical protein